MSSKILQSESLSGKTVIPQVINGAGILDITQTTASSEDDGFNIVTIRLTDGTSMEFKIKNGSKGSTGVQGPQGLKGDKGDPGYTPRREIDYWTQEDKDAIKTYIEESILGGVW